MTVILCKNLVLHCNTLLTCICRCLLAVGSIYLFLNQTCGMSFIFNITILITMQQFCIIFHCTNSCQCSVFVTNTAVVTIQSLGIINNFKQTLIIIEYHNYLWMINMVLKISNSFWHIKNQNVQKYQINIKNWRLSIN